MGCVKVIKDIDLSWMAPEMVSPVVSARTHPRALILEPTRELAIQVKNHLLAAAKHTDISVSSNTTYPVYHTSGFWFSLML